MSKNSPSVPSTPSATDISGAQGQSNAESAIASALLDNVNQVTPYGSTTFNQTATTPINMPNGTTVNIPQFTEQTSLNPGAQQLYNTQLGTSNQLASTASGIANGLNLQPLNLNSNSNSIIQAGPNLIDQASANAAYNQASSFLDPQWNTQQTQLQDQLNSQGIPVGSDAYDNAMTNFNNSKTQAYNAAANSAIQSGAQNAATLYNSAIAGQNQSIGQQTTAQNQPLNLISALLNPGTTLPTQNSAQAAQQTVSPTNILGAYGLQNDANQFGYSANANQYAQNLGGISSLVGNGLLAYALS